MEASKTRDVTSGRLHLELQRGHNVKGIEDPLPRMVGCFDEMKLYPADRLVLTYPVKCR